MDRMKNDVLRGLAGLGQYVLLEQFQIMDEMDDEWMMNGCL